MTQSITIGPTVNTLVAKVRKSTSHWLTQGGILIQRLKWGLSQVCRPSQWLHLQRPCDEKRATAIKGYLLPDLNPWGHKLPSLPVAFTKDQVMAPVALCGHPWTDYFGQGNTMNSGMLNAREIEKWGRMPFFCLYEWLIKQCCLCYSVADYMKTSLNFYSQPPECTRPYSQWSFHLPN